MSSRPASKPPQAGPSEGSGAGREELLRRLQELEAENARLREISLVDPLTGLNNYRYFQEQLDIEIERVRRTGAPCALLMLDIDLFKNVNDTHGHEAGNTVLKEAAAVIRAGTRATDIACRYGGEEFAVILPSTNLEGAVRIAERIRRAIKRKSIEHAATPIQVTVSAGAACFGYAERLSRAEIVEQADAALYQAKRAGRDRVCATPSPSPTTEVGPTEKGLLK